MKLCRRVILFVAMAMLLGGWGVTLGAQAKPTGELNWAWHVTLAPAWFDPAKAPAQISPYLILYAIHDGLVRALPGERMGNSLAESWTESADGLVYEFKLRQGLRFHNDDPFTAEDVKFSFERYNGTGAKELRSKVASVEVVDPYTVHFHLKEPWPDFMTFYGSSATAAGLVVPKKYFERVGDEGFLEHPVGLGPYKFVSHTPGVELVLEANEGYWPKVPNIKRIVIRGVPDVSTRLAMLKKQEADFVSALQGAAAEEAVRDSTLRVVDTRHPSIFWIEFPRPVGPEIAVGGQAPASGGELRAGPQGHQRRRVPGLLSTRRGHHPAADGLRPASRTAPLRPREGQGLARRGRLPERHRRRGVRADSPIL
jgi:peptide/nickel transport system substrate-binding protein